MAATHFLTFSLLAFFLTSSLSNPDFSPNLAVYGGGVQISPTAVHLPNTSLLILKTPLSFLTPTSFSTHFSFSLSPHSTLSLLLVPTAFPQTFPDKPRENPKLLRVEFGSGFVKIRHVSVKLDPGNLQNLDFLADSVKTRQASVSLNPSNGQNLAFVADSVKPPHGSVNLNPGNGQNLAFVADSVKIRNASVKLNLGNRQNLAFVDYVAGANLLEVRLGEPRTDLPIIDFPIDLPEMWKGEGVLVGLESMVNTSVVHSWRFSARVVPKGMHSMPLDPRAGFRVRDGSCYLTVVASVMIAAGVCVFVVFMVMFFKVVFTDWEQVMEMEYVLKPTGKGYEKVVGVDVENNMFGNVKS